MKINIFATLITYSALTSTAQLHSIVLKNDGTVWTWGDNFFGQLGDGTNTSSAFPVKVTGINLTGGTTAPFPDIKGGGSDNDITIFIRKP